jgi:hypothetical protein
MNPQKIHHRYVYNAAVPYDTQSSPLNRQPRWIAGQNVLTSIKGIAERRPGFPSGIETDPTTFVKPGRIYGWRKWSGAFLIMVNDITATQSKIYQKTAGVGNFASLYTGGVAAPYDFATFNNGIFFGNGSECRKWNGNPLTSPPLWGVVSPATAPGAFVFGSPDPSGLSAQIGYRWVYCYHTIYGQVSSPSPISINSLAFTPRLISISGVTSADPQVDSILLFRTTDGGGDIFFQVPGSIPNTGSTWTFTDGTHDEDLLADVAPPAFANDPPPAMRGIVEYATRLWGFSGDSVYYSAFEEQTLGVAEESYPPTNRFRFGSEVTNLQVVNEGILVHCNGSSVYKISGDTLDTFRKDPLFQKMGCRFNAASCSVGKAAVWLDTANLVRSSDGYSQKEMSLDIRPDIAAINQSTSQMVYHSDGAHQWIILMDPTAGKLRVWDLDRENWMPPWVITGSAIASVETSAGVFQLLLAHSSGKILACNYSSYLDNGSPYTADATHCMVNITAEDTTGRLATFEYLALETNSHEPSVVQRVADTDPNGSAAFTWTDITANKTVPDLRSTYGGGMLEGWYKDRTVAGRRIAFKLTWPTENSNFNLYGYDITGSEGQTGAG